MRVTLARSRLGDVRSADAGRCADIGRAIARMECGFAYARYVLSKNRPGPKLANDVSTGLATAARTAEDVKGLAPDEPSRIAAARLASRAASLNKRVRKIMGNDTTRALTAEEAEDLFKRLMRVERKAEALWKDGTAACRANGGKKA